MQIPIPKYLERCWNWATVVETEIGFQYTTWNGKNILSEKMLLEKKIIFFFIKHHKFLEFSKVLFHAISKEHVRYPMCHKGERMPKYIRYPTHRDIEF